VAAAQWSLLAAAAEAVAAEVVAEEVAEAEVAGAHSPCRVCWAVAGELEPVPMFQPFP
jgi:hypothetical protein